MIRPLNVRGLSISNCQKAPSRRCVVSNGFWLRPTPTSPAYNNYRTPEQIKESSAERYWKIANVGFLKFYVVPYPLKFLFLVFWAPVRETLFSIHKRVVVQCSKVDAMLSGKPKDIFKTSGGAETRFDRAIFLDRLHGKRNIFQDLWYWAKLATGRA